MNETGLLQAMIFGGEWMNRCLLQAITFGGEWMNRCLLQAITFGGEWMNECWYRLIFRGRMDEKVSMSASTSCFFGGERMK
ncbi:hypothetical protein DXN04_06925 [Chitinophaga silvisoli]|uniref:Uncharacterized protein n=1 Tax=Chitinophaga silvisoli TaxID=2291814 RepID=A0A3E1P4J4_9BACT|nr:hypothetical protein DXN04_06925 [Chitinophaga silvisoli]